jgi:hypothetical protein
MDLVSRSKYLTERGIPGKSDTFEELMVSVTCDKLTLIPWAAARLGEGIQDPLSFGWS